MNIEDGISTSSLPFINTSILTDKVGTLFPEAQSFKLLTLLDNSSFLILIRTKNGQKIVEISKDYSSFKQIYQFQRYSVVISASLSPNHDKLLVVLFSSTNTFIECSNYHIKCILLNESPNIVYPICNIVDSRPHIEWMPHPNRFVLLTSDNRFEVWELVCSKNSFDLSRISRSEKGITWVGVRNKNILEYTKSGKDNDLLTIVNDGGNISKVDLPQIQVSDSAMYLHISNDKNIDILLVNHIHNLKIILPIPKLYLDVEFTAGKLDIVDAAALDNELLLINIQNKHFLGILFDSFSQPHAVFVLPQKKDTQISFVSSSNFIVIENKTGLISKLVFDFEGIVKRQPLVFFPLFHANVLNSDYGYEILKYIDLNLLHFFWTGVIIEEYILCITRNLLSANNDPLADFFNKNLTTFCPTKPYTKSLSLFKSFQSKGGDDSKTTSSVSNWFSAFSKYSGLNQPHLKNIVGLAIESILPTYFQEEVAHSAMLQTQFVYFRINESAKILPDIKANVMEGLESTVLDTWVQRNIIDFSDIDLTDDEINDMNWWSMRSAIHIPDDCFEADYEFRTNSLFKFTFDQYDACIY